MRLNYVLLFAIATLFTSINASAAATPSTALTQDSASSVREMGTKRTLRTDKAREEERAITDFLTKIKNLVKSKKVVPTQIDPKLAKVASIEVPTQLSTVVSMPTQGAKLQSKLNKLVESKKTTDQVFSILKLNNPATKLFDADALPMFVRFMEKSSKSGANNVYKNGVETLLTHIPEKRLIGIVNSGLQSKSELSFATADRLRAGLVSKWWSEGKTVREITPMLKNGATVLSKSNKELVAKYTVAYNAAYITKFAAKTK
ncbi:hypothetical protein V7S43_011117 [Phytophthora oleae]|uniref:RxLR effector protein n=1 Tax=Phytophthora oleae TaxID=2107226 RepID=A0ABD3FB83_9STRA